MRHLRWSVNVFFCLTLVFLVLPVYAMMGGGGHGGGGNMSGGGDRESNWDHMGSGKDATYHHDQTTDRYRNDMMDHETAQGMFESYMGENHSDGYRLGPMVDHGNYYQRNVIDPHGKEVERMTIDKQTRKLKRYQIY